MYGGFKMDIKKGISYVAFGFLFTLVNFNLNFGTVSVNIMPEFVGWILFFMAHDCLEKYLGNKPYMKWIALIMAIVTGAFWIVDLTKANIQVDIVKMIFNFVSMVYMYILFGSLEKLANDYDSKHTKTIGMLKILNLTLYLITFVFAFIYIYNRLDTYAVITALVGIAALVSAIFTAVILFKLRTELLNYQDNKSTEE